jgi:hypothetical protein
MNATQNRDTQDMAAAHSAGRNVTAHLSAMGMTTIRQAPVRRQCVTAHGPYLCCGFDCAMSDFCRSF